MPFSLKLGKDMGHALGHVPRTGVVGAVREGIDVLIIRLVWGSGGVAWREVFSSRN